MSSFILISIILINYIYQVITITQCNLLNGVDLQSATYTHSLILRAQPIYSSEASDKPIIVSEVLVREIIKLSKNSYHKIKMNDIILIRIDNDLEELLDDACWYLLRVTTVDIILFLNETNTNEFDLRYPPIESTLFVRQNMDAVLHYETYSPQVIIKNQIHKPIIFESYSLQCNVRGNPLPRLLWSKNIQRLEYYPSMKECRTPCRIYSIQNEYESTLYFQTLTSADSGLYVCHAENAINYTMTSFYVDVEQTNTINRLNINVTCATLKYCHNRGQCITIDDKLKCLCENEYIGEQCETNYNDIIKKQNNVIILFKSRLLAGIILILIGICLVLVAFISCYRARRKKTRRNNLLVSTRTTNGRISNTELIEQVNQSHQRRPSLSIPIVHIVNNRSVLMKQSATITSDNNNDEEYNHSNGYCESREIDEENDSSKMNNIIDNNYEKMTNHIILSEGYLEYYQPNTPSALIRPLHVGKDSSKHHKKSRNRPV